MCGICGIFHRDGKPAERQQLERMTALLRHRGPDDEGIFMEDGTGLGFCRLSIIDLSGGRQPMGNEDGSVQVVFNGEIYNFRELRAMLKRQGHVFRTRSDTEVLVHGYEQWGEELVHELNGMFAFAIWDRRRRRLFLARDRLGIKPLFYTAAGTTFAFASEIKGLMPVAGTRPEINAQAVLDYFSQLYVPDPETIYRNVQKLQPGRTLTVDRDGLRLRTYWTPSLNPDEHRTPEEWTEELRHRIVESVERQMVADVPLGVWLSGGLDSSAVTAAMARRGGSRVFSFNVGFDVPAYDETAAAQEVSRHLGSVHETFRVHASATDVLPRLLWYLDEPLADATIIPTYLLCLKTRQKVKVVLSGEGGDELFAGYTHYRGMRLNQELRRVPAVLRRAGISLLGQLPHGGHARLGYLFHRLERILSASLKPPFEDYLEKVSLFTPHELNQLFSQEFRQNTHALENLVTLRSVGRRNPGLDPIAQAGLADLSVYLPGDLLTKVDRMSMACSLEARVPLLDHTLVEFAAAIPTSLKLKGVQTKYILRKAVAPWLPPSIVKGPKRPFVPPLEFWLQANLKVYAERHRMWEALRETGYFNLPYIHALMEAHASGRRNHSRQLWGIFVFALWWRHVHTGQEMPA